jgi:hypothetical protein
MTLRQVTLIALIGIITAFVFSLTNFAAGLARGSLHSSFWFSMGSVFLRDGSLIFLLAHLYSRSAPKS